jgi:hypothetical chaperone protein
MADHFVPEIYAIDFGTTNSLLAAASRDRIHPPIPLDADARDPTILRSVMYFPDATRCYYGHAAVSEYTDRGMHGRLIRSIKKHLPSRSFIGTHIDDRPMNLEDLIAALLREMRVRANRFFDADVTRVVLGRPARFSADDVDDGYAEYRLERAARIAGFTEIAFCPEPIAAAREFRATLAEPRTVLVADFGGGTSDFTVLRMQRDHYDPSDVLGIGGVSVAGDALDASIMRHSVSRHFGAQARYRVPLGSNVLPMPPALMEKICSPAEAALLREADAMDFIRNVQRWAIDAQDARRIEQLLIFVEDRLGFAVFEIIEATKRALSEADAAPFHYSYPGIEIHGQLARDAFERGSEREVARILETLDQTLDAAGITPGEVDLVCCTGGTGRVPMVAAGLAERFGAHKLEQFQTFHSVIRGLAEHAQSVLRESA